MSKEILTIDLDGTLIKSDMLFEAFIYRFFRNPLIIFACFYFLFIKRSKLALKEFLSKSLIDNFSASDIPFNENVKELILQKRGEGYKCYLVSASVDPVVQKFYSAYHELFDGAFGSNKERGNLAGSNKLKFIKELVASEGADSFCYVGDSAKDIVIWNETKEAYCNTTKSSIIGKIRVPKVIIKEKVSKVSKLITLSKAILKQMRVHQWAKNSLIFLPAVATHHLLAWGDYLNLLVAFFAFSFLASSVYIINDFLDINDDRAHVSKRNRPLASCKLPIPLGFILLFVCLGISFGFAYFVSWLLVYMCLAYFILNLAYSIKLKKIVLFDCIILSLMYVYRIGIGVCVTTLILSPWMMSFSFFLFLSLAFVKRYSELYNLAKSSDGKNVKNSRGYHVADMNLIMLFAVVSGVVSVLVCNLYYNSEEVKETFKTLWITYLSLPVLVYWLCRVFLLTYRGQMNEDPVLFAIKDKTSFILGVAFVVLFSLGATLSW